MSTHDVPGANPANADTLSAGCWAEHDDGSLIYVKGTENGQVVYEIYDVASDPPVFYQDAMRQDDFELQFSFDDDSGSDTWLWHDKTPFPWNRVMKTFDKPKPEHASAGDLLSAAERVAQSLKLRSERLRESDVSNRADVVKRKGKSILDRISKAVAAFSE